MGRRLNRALAVSALSLLLFLILIFLTSTTTTTTSSPSRPRIAEADHGRSIPEAPAYQVLYIKSAKPFFLNRDRNDRELAIRTRKKRNRKRRSHHRNGSAGRPFAVMLPKGHVPPSGSSPCHNADPDAAAFVYCDLSTTKP